MNLSDIQSKIVSSPIGGAIQVLASAGSGKTRVLTERVRYILGNTKKDKVIALTFTNKAAEEMQNRLGDSESTIDRSWISTVHSIAQRIVEQYGNTIGLPSDLQIYDRDKDRMEIFLQSLRDDGVDIDEYLNVKDSKVQRGREKILSDYLSNFSVIKRELLSEAETALKFPKVARLWSIYQDYQAALINSGGIDFDDIIVYARRILVDNQWVGDVYRTSYKHLCVDEAQDLNRIQYEFIKAFCDTKISSLFMVGDPDQMIYGFNGSSSSFFCEDFVTEFSPAQFRLKENYRSTKAVVWAANRLKPGSQSESIMALEGGLKIEEHDDEKNEAQWIVSNIQSLLQLKEHPEIEGEISLEHMVVIARNRFVFSALEEEMTLNNLPFLIRRSELSAEASSIFGKILDYGLRVKLNSKDWVDGKKLCALLKTPAPEQWDDQAILTKLSAQASQSSIFLPNLQADLLTRINELDLESPNIRKFTRDSISQLEGIVTQFNNDADELEIANSIEEFQLFQKDWTRFRAKGLGDSLQSFRNAKALGKLAIEASTTGLTLSTVHTMKGLEKDIVFLMGMCEGVFPDYRATTNEKLEEERNSAFVAVTRAKRWLYLSYPKQRVMPWGATRFQTKSRFLDEIGSGLSNS